MALYRVHDNFAKNSCSKYALHVKVIDTICHPFFNSASVISHDV